MLSALLEDFGSMPGLETVTLEDSSIPVSEDEEESIFHELARSANFTLVIAPEFDDLLLTRCRWIEEAGGQSLGSSPAAVELAGDKLALGRHLRIHKTPTPESQPFMPGKPLGKPNWPLVWKPRYGAGSQATFLVRHADELPGCVRQAQAEGWAGEALLQPFVPGLAASVSFLIGPRAQLVLLPGAQTLSQEGRFHYQGGILPLPPPLAERAVRLAQGAIAAVPGLHGYVGVDLILGAATDGSEDWIIEINPRLTTSYVGLRALARTNLAAAMLRIAQGDEVPELNWRPGRVEFQTNGIVRLSHSCTGPIS